MVITMKIGETIQIERVGKNEYITSYLKYRPSRWSLQPVERTKWKDIKSIEILDSLNSKKRR